MFPAIELSTARAETVSAHTQEFLSMEITKEELSELVATQVSAAMAEKARAVVAGEPVQLTSETKPQEVDLISLFELEGAQEDVVNAIKEKWLEQYEFMQKRAEQEALRMMAKVRREKNISEFAARVTGGTEDNPVGMPVQQAKLEKLLLGLSAAQQQEAQEILETIWQSGLTSFVEFGHGKNVKGKTPLPDVIQESLKNGKLTLADLNSPILNLGDLSSYDLSAYKEGK
jgi:hypothetical protein